MISPAELCAHTVLGGLASFRSVSLLAGLDGFSEAAPFAVHLEDMAAMTQPGRRRGNSWL